MSKHDSGYPRTLSTEPRLSAVAAIVARGVLRLRRSSSDRGKDSGSNPSDSGNIGLELPRSSRLHVHNG